MKGNAIRYIWDKVSKGKGKAIIFIQYQVKGKAGSIIIKTLTFFRRNLNYKCPIRAENQYKT